MNDTRTPRQLIDTAQHAQAQLEDALDALHQRGILRFSTTRKGALETLHRDLERVAENHPAHRDAYGFPERAVPFGGEATR